jgi:hypothetical protein
MEDERNTRIWNTFAGYYIITFVKHLKYQSLNQRGKVLPGRIKNAKREYMNK